MAGRMKQDLQGIAKSVVTQKRKAPRLMESQGAHVYCSHSSLRYGCRRGNGSCVPRGGWAGLAPTFAQERKRCGATPSGEKHNRIAKRENLPSPISVGERFTQQDPF